MVAVETDFVLAVVGLVLDSVIVVERLVAVVIVFEVAVVPAAAEA